MTDDTEIGVVVRRLLPVPREAVFAAWLDPASLAQWMRPADVRNVVVEVDPRVGGTFRIVMEHDRGDGEHWGEYLVIEPPSLLSFTWTSSNTDHRPSIVTVELLDKDGATDLIITHRRLSATRIEPHRTGWTEIARKLEETLTNGRG